MDLPDGIHRDIPEADYHALRYVNASSLKAGRTSMAHMRLAMAGGGGSSPAKELGTLAHRLRRLAAHRIEARDLAKTSN